MALVPSIRNTLSGIGALFADGVIYYRTLTSAPNAATRTYSAWVLIPNARCCGFGEEQFQDPASGMWFRDELCQLRVPYLSNVNLTIRDQVRQGDGTGAAADHFVWSIRQQELSGSGSMQSYKLFKRTSMMVDHRQGGV